MVTPLDHFLSLPLRFTLSCTATVQFPPVEQAGTSTFLKKSSSVSEIF